MAFSACLVAAYWPTSAEALSACEELTNTTCPLDFDDNGRIAGAEHRDRRVGSYLMIKHARSGASAGMPPSSERGCPNDLSTQFLHGHDPLHVLRSDQRRNTGTFRNMPPWRRTRATLAMLRAQHNNLGAGSEKIECDGAPDIS